MGVVVGLWDCGSSQDEDGYREYWADWLVYVDGEVEGPQGAMFATGLPLAGSAYTLPAPCTDYDPWAFTSPQRDVKKHPNYNEGEGAPDWYIVTTHASTKPKRRCNSTEIENPLNEPHKISGGYNKVSKERLYDKDGKPLLYLTFERIRGPVVERRTGLPTLTIEVNIPSMPIGALTPAVECVNDAPWWGYAARKVRFMDVTWSRKLYGVCFFYFTATYTFEFNHLGYDLPILSEGMKTLKDADPPIDIEDAKPTDFEFIRDGNGDPIGPLPIKADGKPVEDPATELHYLDKKIDLEFNFALLPGVPVTL
jgi:hypothetical protein